MRSNEKVDRNVAVNVATGRLAAARPMTDCVNLSFAESRVKVMKFTYVPWQGVPA